MKLTKLQTKTLKFIDAFQKRLGRVPEIKDLSAHFGVAGSTIFERLKVIEKKGYLRKRYEILDD